MKKILAVLLLSVVSALAVLTYTDNVASLGSSGGVNYYDLSGAEDYTGLPGWSNSTQNVMLVPFTNSPSPWLDVGYQAQQGSGNNLANHSGTITHTPGLGEIGSHVTLDATGSMTGAVANAANIAVWVRTNYIWRLLSSDGTNTYVDGESVSFATNNHWYYDGTTLTITGAYDYGMVPVHSTALSQGALKDIWQRSNWNNPSNYPTDGAEPFDGGYAATGWDYSNRTDLLTDMAYNVHFNDSFVSFGGVQNSLADFTYHAFLNDSGGGAATWQIFTNGSYETGVAYYDGGDSILTPSTAFFRDYCPDNTEDDAITMGGWFKIQTLPGDGQRDGLIHAFDSARSESSGPLIVLELQDDQTLVRYWVYDLGAGFIGRTTAASSITTGQWYRIDGVYDPGPDGGSNENFRIYIDGVRADTTDMSGGTYTNLYSASYRTVIGGTVFSGTKLTGWTDDIGVWTNRALTASEVTNNIYEPTKHFWQ